MEAAIHAPYETGVQIPDLHVQDDMPTMSNRRNNTQIGGRVAPGPARAGHVDDLRSAAPRPAGIPSGRVMVKHCHKAPGRRESRWYATGLDHISAHGAAFELSGDGLASIGANC